MTARTTTSSPVADKRRAGGALTPDGKRYLVRDHMAALLQLVLLLGFARTLGWRNAWLYGGLLFGAKIVIALSLVRLNPSVINARGVRHEISRQEKRFFLAFIPLTLLIPIVAALDVGAVGWTHHSLVTLALGGAMWAVGTFVVAWAMAANEFFEPTVRIQSDRDHRVCSSGPYRFVRHPGYTGILLVLAGIPLMLGSFWSFVPSALAALAFVMRTRHEDRLLRTDLQGYEAYAAEVRSRLVPGIW